ncbi:tyrosine-type recombinase/integrase [Lentzea flava]|uniref:Tyrosine recombinase XerC n=1 Tax=Lentzea flava TaxID=103732 RepID=A0ABQ2VG42_9PSEU|nr:tyrosine-type recombinase/integrase [Lentzea flava]MCP2205249.1 Site-specific recombinase XerD [Lentzea flava]GGU85011.1 tyrosine recombinase XerC [Lentzea flava]
MTKSITFPAGGWGLHARGWHRALKAQNKSDNTIRIYIYAVRQLGEWAYAQAEPFEADETTPDHINEFMADLIEKTSAPNGHTNYRALRTFFKWMVESEEEMDRSPMDRTKAPDLPEQPVPIVSDGGMAELLNVCKGKDFESVRDTAIIRLYFDTAARLSEAVLNLDDLDLDVDVIRVLGKGRRQRTIPFGPKTGTAITRYLKLRAKHKHASRPELWLGLRGPMTADGIKQMIKRRGRQAGIENMFAHRLRHTFAHTWQLKGGNETDLMRIMGWKSDQMLRRYGASAADERAQLAHRAMALGDRV